MKFRLISLLFILLASSHAFGAIDFVKRLIGISSEIPSIDEAELREIVESDDLEAFKKLVAKFPDIINAKIGHLDAPVFSHAVHYSKKRIPEFILTCKNFDVNAYDNQRWCPLMHASVRVNSGIDLFKKLCQVPGINPDITRDYNSTVLNWTASHVQTAKINLQGKKYQLSGYGTKEDMESYLNFKLQTLELLLRIGANPYHKDNYCGIPTSNAPEEIKEICQKIKLEYKPEMQNQLREIANIPEEVSELVLDYFI